MSDNREKLNEHLLNVVLSEKDSVAVKLKKMNYMFNLGVDVDARLWGKSVLSWVKSNNVEPEIKDFLIKNGAKEWVISTEEAWELGRCLWDEYGKPKSIDEVKKIAKDGGCLCRGSTHNKVIWRCLTLDEINEVLKTLPRGYVISGSVNLRGKELTRLPDFSKVKVGWNFDCSNNILSSLEGAPMEVYGSFYCINSGLKSLKGASCLVKGDFDCSNNMLKSLDGAPKMIRGDFIGKDNCFVSFKGVTQKIGGEFMVEDEVIKRILENEKGEEMRFIREFMKKDR